MPILALWGAVILMIVSSYAYHVTGTDTAYLVTHLYLITALILTGMVKINDKSHKNQNEPTSSGKLSEKVESNPPKDTTTSSGK